MRVEDLEAYFAKRIAKPFVYDVSLDEGIEQLDYYAIEPVGVRDGKVFATVTLKFSVFDGVRQNLSRYCGDVAIPLEDGDKIEAILLMAVAGTVYEGEEKLPKLYCTEPDLMEQVIDELNRRRGEQAAVLKP